MATYLQKDALKVDAALARFVEERALPGSGVTAAAFWAGMAALAHDFGPRNRALLAHREELQQKIDPAP